jgi:hypothetical protein
MSWVRRWVVASWAFKEKAVASNKPKKRHSVLFIERLFLGEIKRKIHNPKSFYLSSASKFLN